MSLPALYLGILGQEASRVGVRLSANVTLNTPKRRKRFNWWGAAVRRWSSRSPAQIGLVAKDTITLSRTRSTDAKWYLISELLYRKSDCQMVELTVCFLRWLPRCGCGCGCACDCGCGCGCYCQDGKLGQAVPGSCFKSTRSRLKCRSRTS